MAMVMIFDGKASKLSMRDFDGLSSVEATKIILELHAGKSLSAWAPLGISWLEVLAYALGYPVVDSSY